MKLTKYIKKFIGKWVWIPIVKYYLSQERNIKVNDIHIKIPAGVFHPTLFLSTQLLLKYTNSVEVKNLKALELGAGSGLLSVAMAKRGALAYASDISIQACASVQENAKKNDVSIKVIHSDLFDDFRKLDFDLILINPPYYPKNAKTENERAWFCGSNFEYFQKLFLQLSKYIKKNGQAIMVLSEDCDINRINQMAIESGYLWKQIHKERLRGEWNYLFKITFNL